MKKDKELAQELFDSMGLTFSGALNIFIKACINTRSIPFNIKAPSLDQVIKDRLKESEDPLNLSRKFNDVENMMESLES